MDTEEIERILTGAEETDALEFKSAVPWDRNLFVKDILAMANVTDGGRIVVGVQDGSFTRIGLTAGEADSYNIEVMRDQIAPFADPRAVFRVEKATDRLGLLFVVIDVSRFEEIPVICKRDGSDVKAGTIYFRSRTRRPESAPVTNSSDMRDLIELSVVRSAQRLQRIGFVPALQPGPDYDSELGGL